MRPTTSKIHLFVRQKLRRLLLTMFACVIVSACSSGGGENPSGINLQSDMPNPYANGYRVVQVIKTFVGQPYSVQSYTYNEEKSTIELKRTRGDDTSSKIQTLNTSGLIIQSLTPGEDNLLSDNDRVWEYGYNAKGQLTSRKDLDGFPIIRYVRDAQGNIIEQDGIETIEYTYDVNGLLESALDTLRSELYVFEYNAAGQLSGGVTKLDDGSVFARFEVLYDENGNVSEVTDYNRADSPIFSDRYVYEATDKVIVNHALMRLLNELPNLTITPF